MTNDKLYFYTFVAAQILAIISIATRPPNLSIIGLMYFILSLFAASMYSIEKDVNLMSIKEKLKKKLGKNNGKKKARKISDVLSEEQQEQLSQVHQANFKVNSVVHKLQHIRNKIEDYYENRRKTLQELHEMSDLITIRDRQRIRDELEEQVQVHERILEMVRDAKSLFKEQNEGDRQRL